MRKIFTVFTAILLCFCFALNAYAVFPTHKVSENDIPDRSVFAESSVSARSAILVNSDDLSVYFEKNADERLGPASTTKLMTAIVALRLSSPDRIITIPKEAVGIEGSSIYLVTGEKLSLEELLYALLLSSANDAAVAIAVALSGSIESFVDEMNSIASELGLTDTHFTNPHGLYDEYHYTTARELAMIAREALSVELIEKIVSSRRATISHDGVSDKRLLVNHNKLLARYEGAIGMKTGFTKKTGRTLVSAARRDGLTLIAVTLDAPSDWNDHSLMLDYGFDNYEKKTFFSAREFIYDIPLSDAEKSAVSLTNFKPLSITVRRGVGAISVRVEAPSRFLVAPVKEGDDFGSVTVEYGELSVSSPLVITESVLGKTKPKRGFFERIFSFFTIE